jgi:hypothetical protein
MAHVIPYTMVRNTASKPLEAHVKSLRRHSHLYTHAEQVALDMKSRGEVSKVGVVDFCNTGLTRLHDYIHVWPWVSVLEDTEWLATE